MSRTRSSASSGFTLIELVIVITLLGVFAAILTLVTVQPFQAAQDQTERARLVDQADLVIDRIRREVRTAVPNSVRTTGPTGGREAVEFVPTETGGRYRRLPPPGGPADGVLNRSQSQDRFDVLGELPGIGAIQTGDGGINDCAAGGTDCMNIFNTGQANFNIYQDDNIAEIINVFNAGPPFNDDELEYQNDGTMPAFNAHSPRQRFVVFDDVVSFVCDNNTEQLLRYSGYGLMGGQPLTNADFGVNDNVVTNDVTNCDFDYQPGAATRQGVLKVEIQLTRNGETVELFGQTHVVNVP